MIQSVSISWARIDTWLKANAFQAWQGLNPGASQEEIAKLEAAIGEQLPEDFKASYCIHNGVKFGYEFEYVFMGMTEFCPLTSVAGGERDLYYYLLQEKEWADQVPKLVDASRIQPVWRHPKWLTFAKDSSQEQDWCLDLAPASLGQRGQIISWMVDDGPGEVIFPNFASLLATYADLLEAGFLLGFYSLPYYILTREQIQHRRSSFLCATPAKPLLQQAVQLAWAEEEERSQALCKQVLQMADATVEDRFLAYSALFSSYQGRGYADSEAESFFTQWKIEALNVPEEHWTRAELSWRANMFR
ncbi:SMI1/KNR4 family protein [Ktedonosporobacter rubrisoli]|nr:SMI1/KNR4 family protein [Ktedonosporobacter rubrisoli]